MGFFLAAVDNKIFHIFSEWSVSQTKIFEIFEQTGLKTIINNYGFIVLGGFVFLTYIFWIKNLKIVPIIRDLFTVFVFSVFSILIYKYFLYKDNISTAFSGLPDLWTTAGLLVIFLTIAISNFGGILEKELPALRNLAIIVIITLLGNLSNFIRNGFSYYSFVNYFVYLAMVYIFSLGTKIILYPEAIVSINLDKDWKKILFYPLTVLVLFPFVGIMLSLLAGSWLIPDDTTGFLFVYSPVIIPAGYLHNLLLNDIAGFIMLILAVNQETYYYYHNVVNSFEKNKINGILTGKQSIISRLKNYLIPQTEKELNDKIPTALKITGSISLALLLLSFYFPPRNQIEPATNYQSKETFDPQVYTFLNPDALYSNIDDQFNNSKIVQNFRAKHKIEGWENFVAHKVNDSAYVCLTDDSLFSVKMPQNEVINSISIGTLTGDGGGFDIVALPPDEIGFKANNKLTILDLNLQKTTTIKTNDEINNLKYFQQYSLLIISDLQNVIYFVKNNKIEFEKGLNVKEITSLELSADGLRLYVGSPKETLTALDTKGNIIFTTEIKDIKLIFSEIMSKQNSYVYDIAISEKHKKIITFSKSFLGIFDENGNLLEKYFFSAFTSCKYIKITPDGDYLTFVADQNAYILNLKTNELQAFSAGKGINDVFFEANSGKLYILSGKEVYVFKKFENKAG